VVGGYITYIMITRHYIGFHVLYCAKVSTAIRAGGAVEGAQSTYPWYMQPIIIDFFYERIDAKVTIYSDTIATCKSYYVIAVVVLVYNIKNSGSGSGQHLPAIA
jgi:hypothetical protein